MVPVNVESVERTPQLVGLNRKCSRLIETLSVFRRSGMPPTVRGSVLLVMINREVIGSTLIVASTFTFPRLNVGVADPGVGPATAGTTIERP